MANPKSKIDTPEKLERILDDVVQELVHARVYMQLYLNINASFDEYKREVNNAGTFWFLTRKSLYESTLIRLCRAYDAQEGANGLHFVLQCIQDNPNFFDFELFRRRNPGHSISVHSKKEVNHPLPDQLEKDVEFASKKIRLLIA